MNSIKKINFLNGLFPDISSFPWLQSTFVIYWFPNTHLQPRPVTYAHLIKCLKLLMWRSNEHLYWRLYQLSTAKWQTVPKCSGLKQSWFYLPLLSISAFKNLLQPFHFFHTQHTTLITSVEEQSPGGLLFPILLSSDPFFTLQFNGPFKNSNKVLWLYCLKPNTILWPSVLGQYCMLWGLKDTYHSFIFPLLSCHLLIEKNSF